MMHNSRDEFVARYCVVKHSWKGKYTRLFCVGRHCVATIDPKSIFSVTNIFDYTQVVDVIPSPKGPTDIQLQIRKGAGTDTMTFSCMSIAERNELLSDVQHYRPLFDPTWLPQVERQIFTCRKYRSNEEWVGVNLQVTNTAVLQKTPQGDVVGSYSYMYIRGVGAITGDNESIVIRYGRHNKLHLYQCTRAADFVALINEMAVKFVGMQRFDELPGLASHEFDLARLGIGRTELAPTAEFPVMKISAKHGFTPLRRILSTTEKLIVERDPQTYNAVSVYNLEDVFAVIRCEDDAQKFMIEYKEPHVAKTYTSPCRDALLAHLVDSCRAINHGNVAVLTQRADRGKRAAPVRSFVSEEIEGTLLRCLIEPSKGGGPVTMAFNEVVEFFNANVEYSGLRSTENRDGFFSENREKLIFGAVSALLDNFPKTDDPHILVQQFYALRRLCVTRTGFASVAVIPTLVKAIGAAAVTALKLHHTAVSHAVIDFLTTIMTPHHDNYEPYHEQINKHRMISSDTFLKHLLVLLRTHIEQDSGALVIHSLLDFFVYALCPPYSEITDGDTFQYLLNLFVDMLGKPIYALFCHPCRAIRYSAGSIVSVIMEEGNEDHFFTMQRAALTEGGFLRQFHVAAFTTNDRALRDLSRKLISYFSFEHQTAQDLMRRMLPVTLLCFLQSKDLAPADEREAERKTDFAQVTQGFLESKQGFFKKQFNPRQTLGKDAELMEEVVVLRQREVRVQPTLNWALFFAQLKTDHLRPDLIWNHGTRTELREGIENEIQAFQLGLEMKTEKTICWNYQEFEVQYPSLAGELRVGHHYPRLLFESTHPEVARPKEFFNDMYHRFLLVQDFDQRTQCLQGMAILYEHYPEEIGQFNDIEFMVQMLDNATSPIFRDRMLVFLTHLLRARLNVKPFIDCNGMKPLVELLTLAHLHIDRPQTHTNTMAIENTSSPVDLQRQEKEWHYVNDAGEKQEPISFAEVRDMLKEGTLKPTTKVWAQGQGGWKEIHHVPQLKWGILTAGQPSVMTLTEVSCTVLDALMLLCAYYPTRDEDGSVMQPLPRVKRFLSDPGVLPHIVQLLLTFDPAVCTRVNRLLHLLMEDNPLMPRLFLSGFFFFSLMYTGSDIVPLCRMLSLGHRKQSFRFDSDNEIIRSSILSPMLPPAMVCVLANHGPQKFAEIFLGEFETPEAIWGKDMRRFLIEKIAAHIGDFTPRLMGNVRATYSYCPIVGVEFEQLKNELFCSMYYLRHFCDAVRYPTWPVADPVALMRDILTAWKMELEKEPSTMSRDKCLETLQIEASDPTPSQIRKAYFKLAAVYHPDKNPNGREMFEAIQRAYEFLASDAEVSDAPEPMKIQLLLRAQSILFDRFAEKMSEYKYAGYGLLLKLMRMEQEDPDMLNKPVVLMDPAVELCFHTVNNAPLNADELLAEGGIDLISEVMNRCFELVTPSSTDNTVQARIAANSIRTFGVAGQFDDCLARILTIPTIAVQAGRGVAFLKSPKLSKAAVVCAQAFCKHRQLQQLVTEAGVVWHLLLYIFRYDYTLEEAGVTVSEENHTQLFDNLAAKSAFRCLCACAGYHPGPEDLVTEFNDPVHRLLTSLLTPFIVTKMQREPNKESEVLKYLNSNSETPYFLWNNAARSELRDFLQANSDLARSNAGGFGEMPTMEASGFEYSTHRQELIVGGIFVRVYNLQPQYAIADPEALLRALVHGSQAALAASNTEHIAMEMEAMRNLLIAYPHISTTAAEHMPAVFQLLAIKDADVVRRTFEMLCKCCTHIHCIETIGLMPTAISDIILALELGPDVFHPALVFVQQILVDRDCVLQALDRGLYAVLLHIFCTSRNVEVKEAACVALAKACNDKLTGPKIMLRSSKLIPGLFIDTMKENPPQATQMFETSQENPELVWNPQVRDRYVADIARAKGSIVDALTTDRETHWKLSDELIRPDSIEDLQVGGVYLALFAKQPNWAVRRPRDFLQNLMEKFAEVSERDEDRVDAEVLDLVTTCITQFLAGTPSVADYLVASGNVPRLARNVSHTNEKVAHCAVHIFHEVAQSRACVESMNPGAGVDPIAPLLNALPRLEDDIGVIMDTLDRLMARSSEKANMIKLGLDNQLPQKLLQMLESGMQQVQSAASARAIIIKVLKTMLSQRDPMCGAQLEHILNESPVWWKYKDQNHDLFLTSGAFGGFITGPRQGPMLSLTAGPTTGATSRMDDEPPPV